MAEKDCKDKIRKLLALSESPNEHEAKAALLKAKQLMAEHKITELDIKDVEKQEVRKILTGITCSKRRNPWMVALSAVIGENYCCQAYRDHRWGEQTQQIGFVGLEDDIEICIAIFKYAVECVMAEHKRMKKKYSPENGYSSPEARAWVKRTLDGYGFGFAKGVNIAFEEQRIEKEQSGDAEFALVMVMPTEVKDACSNFGHKSFRGAAQEQMSRDSYFDGIDDGKNFSPERRLQEA